MYKERAYVRYDELTLFREGWRSFVLLYFFSWSYCILLFFLRDIGAHLHSDGRIPNVCPWRLPCKYAVLGLLTRLSLPLNL